MIAFTGQKMGSVGCNGSQNKPEGKFSTEPLSWGTDYMVLMVLDVIRVFLGVVLVVWGVSQHG